MGGIAMDYMKEFKDISAEEAVILWRENPISRIYG